MHLGDSNSDNVICQDAYMHFIPTGQGHIILTIGTLWSFFLLYDST